MDPASRDAISHELTAKGQENLPPTNIEQEAPANNIRTPDGKRTYSVSQKLPLSQNASISKIAAGHIEHSGTRAKLDPKNVRQSGVFEPLPTPQTTAGLAMSEFEKTQDTLTQFNAKLKQGPGSAVKEGAQQPAAFNSHVEKLADDHLKAKTTPGPQEHPVVKQQVLDRMAVKLELKNTKAITKNLEKALKDKKTVGGEIAFAQAAQSACEKTMDTPAQLNSIGADIYRYFTADAVRILDAEGKDLMASFTPTASSLTDIGQQRFRFALKTLMENQKFSTDEIESTFARLDGLLASSAGKEWGPAMQTFVKELPQDGKLLTLLKGFDQTFLNTPATSIKKNAAVGEAKVNLMLSSQEKTITVKMDPSGTLSFHYPSVFIDKPQVQLTEDQKAQNSRFSSYLTDCRYEVHMDNRMAFNNATNRWESVIETSVGTPLIPDKSGKLDAETQNAQAITKLKRSLASKGYDVHTHFMTQQRWT